MAKVTGKLQITLPKALAEQCGIRVGDELELRQVGSSIQIERRTRDLSQHGALGWHISTKPRRDSARENTEVGRLRERQALWASARERSVRPPDLTPGVRPPRFRSAQVALLPLTTSSVTRRYVQVSSGCKLSNLRQKHR